MLGVGVVLTVNILLVSFEALNDSCVRLQTALTQLVQVIHHVVVRLNQGREKVIGNAAIIQRPEH